VVGVVTLAVALLVAAFVFREQTPYEFLRGERRHWTHIAPYPTIHDESAMITYVSDLSISEVEEKARNELLPKGWLVRNGRFVSPGGIAETFRVGSGDSYVDAVKRGVYGKTLINIHRPATINDRILAFIDGLLGK